MRYRCRAGRGRGLTGVGTVVLALCSLLWAERAFAAAVDQNQEVLNLESEYTNHNPNSNSNPGADLSADADVDVTKSIAIVGAGSAGLAMLKVLLDLPENVRRGWEIVLFEERMGVGGVWLPDSAEPHPPTLPETPLYPGLKTNTPHPTMTYPRFPFRARTPLFPTHEYVEQYHVDYAEAFGLMEYVRLNTSVVRAAWVVDADKADAGEGEREGEGMWNVTVLDKNSDALSWRGFDHLVVANGHNRYPLVPTWPGQEAWLQAKMGREILHTVFWRGGERYAGKTVLVVGSGASGRDVILHTAPFAKKVYLSSRSGAKPRRLDAPYVLKPGTERFTEEGIVFADGTRVEDVDAVVLGTGYEVRVPFLTDGSALDVAPYASGGPGEDEDAPEQLTTNLQYIYPLHEHVFSLARGHPPTALTFVGLPVLVANCPSDIAQALLVAYALADEALLPSRAEMLAQLRRREAHFRERGVDPYKAGHRLIDVDADPDEGGRRPDASHAYQDELVRFLKERGALPDDGRPFVEEWRRWSREEAGALWDGWQRVEGLGGEEVERWVAGARTEEEWVDVMHRLVEWEKRQVRDVN
ncbi:hypothetical protein M0805_008469 [Coniferiporia weirii]|nr:hypothetical protein M0805_008469 [Coniferiporia weirii]